MLAESMMVGGQLMLLGMGTVFTFLVILVFILKGMSGLANLIDDGEEEPRRVPVNQAVTPNNGNDAKLVAVISAAVTRFRAKRSH